MKKFLYICFSYFIFGAYAHGQQPASVMDRYIALAIQGNLQPAVVLLDGLDQAAVADGSRSDRELAIRFRERFVEGSEPPFASSGSALIDAVVAAYREYWRHCWRGARRRRGPAGCPATALRAAGLRCLTPLRCWRRHQRQGLRSGRLPRCRTVCLAPKSGL
jgi:hypothetical protein